LAFGREYGKNKVRFGALSPERKDRVMKRQFKKQLKEDEFVSGMTKFMRFVKAWEHELIIAGVAAVIIVGIFFGFQLLKAGQVRKDSRILGEILDLRTNLAKTPENAAKLEQLSGTGKFSRLAEISLATYWIEQGQPDKAQAVLEKIKDPTKDFFYYQAQDLAAQVALLKGDPDRAIGILKKVEDEKPKDYILDAVLFHHAEALEKKGNSPEALALYKRLQEEYAQSYYGYDASLRARKLEAAK
jgi:predicted negative regulator of RcsB-dependent stress response